MCVLPKLEQIMVTCSRDTTTSSYTNIPLFYRRMYLQKHSGLIDNISNLSKKNRPC